MRVIPQRWAQGRKKEEPSGCHKNDTFNAVRGNKHLLGFFVTLFIFLVPVQQRWVEERHLAQLQRSSTTRLTTSEKR